MPTYNKYICENCKKEFLRSLKQDYTNRKQGQRSYCSMECMNLHKFTGETVSCATCNKKFYKRKAEIKKTSNNFCSHSCSATYTNTHKTTGTRRSKLELYLESELIKLYPKLDIKFNDKTIINSELDIYIPSLKLAFELNGIYHYEPIHGQDKLNQIQNNDCRKFQACLDAKIELCIIDSSGLKYFKPDNAKKYLDIIVNIINSKL